MARIIIAAKDGPVRRAIHGMLKGQGHKVRCVSHGAEAYEALSEETAELVICDANMPVMDGVALMMIGRVDWKNVRFLLMSEDPHLARTLERVEIAVDGIVAKPFHIQTLRDEVQRLLPIGAGPAPALEPA
jgi:DNA-binding response OmpR family regulator